jgi:hypothetical protein
VVKRASQVVDSGDAPHAGNDSGEHPCIFAGFLFWQA